MKDQMHHGEKESLAHLSDRFIRALPTRQGKIAEADNLMALFAPSAWGVGLEGIEIKMGNCRLVAGCFGAELFFDGRRAGFPEHFRLCLTRCYGQYNYESAAQLAGPALQRAAVLSQIFIALACPDDELAWVQARATARAAKANGSFVLLVAAQRDWYSVRQDVIGQSIANFDPEDAHCLLCAEVVDPIRFLQAFSWALMPALANSDCQDDTDMAAIRQLFEHGYACIRNVVHLKKRTLSEALVRMMDGYELFELDIKESAGIIVLLDNRDYPDSTPEELVAEVKDSLSGISPVHVVVNGISDGDAYPESCSLKNLHDFFVIASFDFEALRKRRTSGQ